MTNNDKGPLSVEKEGPQVATKGEGRGGGGRENGVKIEREKEGNGRDWKKGKRGKEAWRTGRRGDEETGEKR